MYDALKQSLEIRFHIENDQMPIHYRSYKAVNGQVNTNPRGGVSLKWTKLYFLSVLVVFFFGLMPQLASERCFETIIRNTFFSGNDQIHRDTILFCS